VIDAVDIDFGNGTQATFECASEPSHLGLGVMIIALDGENNVFLLEEYQVGAKKRLLILPRWWLDDHNDPIVKANEELQEEIGIKAKKLTQLTQLEIFPGWHQAKTKVFLAQDLVESKLEGDEHGELVVYKMPLEEAVKKVMNWEIVDSRTVAGLLYVKEWMAQWKI